MARKPEDELRDLIAKRQVVVIAGTGVSLAATERNSLASWKGLLLDGVDCCVSLKLTDAEWKRRLLDEIGSGDLDDLLSAAEKISRKLGAPSNGEYAKWLRESVGSLHVQQLDVLKALHELDNVLATTNYDGLLEEVTELSAVTWRDKTKAERVIRGDEKKCVLHLHGHWEDPASVVLGIRSYEQLLGNEHAQTMQAALRTMKTLLFVGCGEGLGDPNFGALLRWSGKVFEGSEYRMYALAREADVDALQAAHSLLEKRVCVISYGDKFTDLAPFLQSLRPDDSRDTGSHADASPTLLPPVGHCFGRDDEIEDMVGTLLADQPEPMVVLGGAGMGKTTVSLAAAHDTRVADRYGARRFFIRCDSINNRETLAATIAQALNLNPSPGIEKAMLAELARERALLILDNAESPWETDMLPCEELFGALAGVSGLALIASFRGNEWPPKVRWVSIKPPQLPLDDAREAFLAVAGGTFRNDPHLDDLLKALDGLPLAITLLACAAQGESDLCGLWTRWQEEEHTEILARGTVKTRETSLAVSLKISFDSPRMTPDARRMLSLLALLPNGVAYHDLPVLLPNRSQWIASLLHKVGLAFPEGERLRMLAPVRDYVAEKHPAPTADRTRVIGHYLNLTSKEAVKVGMQGGAEAVKRLTPEISNIEAMIDAGLKMKGKPAKAIAAAIEYAKFIRISGMGSLPLIECAATTATENNKLLESARCFFWLGQIALHRSDNSGAWTRFEKALPLYQQMGNPQGEAHCIHSLGEIALRRSDHAEAQKRYEEAFPLYQQVGDLQGGANCIWSLGKVALQLSDYAGARARNEEALTLYRRVDDVLGEANCIHSLGDIALKRDSDHDEARARYEEALPLYRRVGDVLGEANCICGIGDIALRHDADHAVALARYMEALALYERRQEPYSIGRTHRCLARMADGETEREVHVAAARSAWASIGRDDLLAELDEEFGKADADAPGA